MGNNYNMTFEESQDYISRRGFDIPWNDCDVFVDEREIERTVGNVLKWADTTMLERVLDFMRTFQNGNGEFPLYDYIGNIRKAMEE